MRTGMLSGCLAGLLLAVLPVHAQELRLQVGGLESSLASHPTYTWALEYRTPISPVLTAGFTWLNEGHLDGHHRDGQAVQVWWHSPGAGRLRFEMGLGPYYYFDTVARQTTAGYSNEHGWGLLASMGVTAFHGIAWSTSLRLNRVQVPGGFNSTGLLAGLGYRFGPSATEHTAGEEFSSAPTNLRRMELDLMLGGTVLNSFESNKAVAGGIGLRWRATPLLGFSLGYIDEGRIEGGVNGGRRSGVAAQVWLEKDLTQRVSIGAGLGPYIALEKPAGENVSNMSAISSVTASYRLTPAWVGRLTWNRISTRYNRDSDLVLFAVGRSF